MERKGGRLWGLAPPGFTPLSLTPSCLTAPACADQPSISMIEEKSRPP